MTELRSIKQKLGETVDAYVARLKEKWRRVDHTRAYPEEDRLNQFINGLRSEFIIQVRSAMPNTEEEAINIAKAIEVAYSGANDLSAYSLLPDYEVTLGIKPPVSKIESIERKLLTKFEDLLNPIGESIKAMAIKEEDKPTPNDNNKFSCRRCKKFGHTDQNCLTPFRGSCLYCKKPEHMKRECRALQNRQKNNGSNFSNRNNNRNINRNQPSWNNNNNNWGPNN